jgi:Agrobacterium tumefaciens protein Atu4866
MTSKSIFRAGLALSIACLNPAQDRYVGTWVTADGYIRHQLLRGGRFDESRGNRKSAYRGRYTLTGDHIDYVDDTGFTADGDFRDGVLHHAGMVLYREVSTGGRP